jgi:hypothetical protein
MTIESAIDSKQEDAMLDLPSILVGFAALCALALVLLAHDWRDEFRERRAMRNRVVTHPLRDWLLKHSSFRHRH